MKRSQLALSLLSFAASWTLLPRGAWAQTTTAAPDARSIVLIAPTGKEAADLEIASWQQRLAQKPNDAGYWERLGWAYIAKARLTQDPGYYKLAELTVTAWEASCGPSAQARLLQGHVDHNLHRFKEAEAIARALVAERKAPADYALLSDALMEQGKLEEAVAACQTLANLRPGVESYSRIAHLRLLYGDLGGAIQAMEAAIRAGSPRDIESRAWMYSRLAGYELLGNDPLKALSFANAALQGAPNHPLALAAKGRALYALGEYDASLLALRRAAELNPIPDNQWWLADVLRARGKADEASAIEEKLQRRGPATDPRTVALFLDTRGEKFDQAARLASAELANRGDVFTHDANAFALLRSGHPAAAAEEIKLAQAHHTTDPRLAFHAGLVAAATGNHADAIQFFAQAKAMANSLTPSERTLLDLQVPSAVATSP